MDLEPPPSSAGPAGSRRRPARAAPVVAMLAAVLLWGPSFVATKLALRDLPPLTIAFLRFLIASAVLYPLWRLSSDRRAHRPRRRQMLLGGLVGVTLYFTLENLGVQRTTAGDAAMLMAAIPIIALVAEAVWFRQAVNWLRGAAIAASIFGVALVVAPASGLGGTNRLLGNLLVLAAALAWAAYSIMGKALEKFSKVTVVAHQTIYGTLMLAPLALMEAADWKGMTVAGGLSILYLGVMCSAVTYLLFNYALQALAASQVTAFLNLVPIIGVIAAAVILGEPVQPVQALGGAIIIAGVVATTGTKRQPTSEVSCARGGCTPSVEDCRRRSGLTSPGRTCQLRGGPPSFRRSVRLGSKVPHPA